MNPSRIPSPAPADRRGWRSALSRLRSEPAHSRILGGSLVMLVGSGLVSAVNFGYNVAVARLLGPAGFGHAAAAVTLLMLISAITLAYQLVCAKFVARNESAGAKAAVYRTLLRRAWIVGILLGGVIGAASRPVATYLHLPSANLVILLAAGIAFYIPLGVKRGGLQGVCAFRGLSANFILEALVKFLGAIVLILLGYGVLGAVAAIAGSVILAYFVPPTPRELRVAAEAGLPASFGEGIQAIVFFVGQVVINNIDILLVKHFFAATAAGMYAAVALVGRVVYMLSWSVVSAMFPVSAGGKRTQDDVAVLFVPLGIVLGIALVFTVGLGLFPKLALRVVFGPGFAAQGFGGLLMLYAAATGVYSLGVVLMAYEMSRRIANTSWVQLAFSGAIMVGICLFHSTLREVVMVQFLLMILLLIATSVPFLFFKPAAAFTGRAMALRTAPLDGPAEQSPAVRRRRRVPEADIIAFFLRNEFHHAEFAADRHHFAHLVMNANTADAAENALRRALLFRRRGTMWRELPADTQWWEMEMSASAIEHLRVFPRGQWRKLASGSFVLSDIVARIRANGFHGRTAKFVMRMRRFSERLRVHGGNDAILLIGIDERQPLTIIEGNHRLTAAMLASPQLARQRFRFYCGFSPHMTDCCWYQTNLSTLYRYALNRLKIVRHDREADIARLLNLHHPVAANDGEDEEALIASGNEIQTRQAS